MEDVPLVRSLMRDAVLVKPRSIGSDFSRVVEGLLKRRFEGVCSRHGFVVPGTIRLHRIVSARVEAVSLNGDVRYDVQYFASVCNPPVGSVLSARVVDTNRFGVLAHSGITSATDGTFLPIVASIVPRKAIEGVESEVDVTGVSSGDTVWIEILGQKFELNDTKISVIGRLVPSSSAPPSAGAPPFAAAGKFVELSAAAAAAASVVEDDEDDEGGGGRRGGDDAGSAAAEDDDAPVDEDDDEDDDALAAAEEDEDDEDDEEEEEDEDAKKLKKKKKKLQLQKKKNKVKLVQVEEGEEDGEDGDGDDDEAEEDAEEEEDDEDEEDEEEEEEEEDEEEEGGDEGNQTGGDDSDYDE